MKKFKTFIIVIAVILGLGFVGSLLPDEETTTDNPVTFSEETSVSTESTSEEITTEELTSVTTSATTTSTTKTTATTKIGTYSSVIQSASSLPKYNGSPYAVVNNNNPQFSTADKKNTSAFEKYSNLDSLGRCGVAYANICREIMPTEPRGEIGMIKPSGWQTIRYNGVVEGNYLYNRCHLIGYQLAGENANVKNLITGTRYMNTQGMEPFESRVANYVESTGNHVLYRVTPVFVGNELVARGVRMEAYSVEDNGAGICYNIFCFNVQPDISINYATGDSSLNSDATTKGSTTKTTTKNTPPASRSNSGGSSSGSYIANTNSKKFHYPSCGSVDQMSEKNKWYFNGSRDELINQGYQPCKRCNP